MMEYRETPVLLLTGYLGSGKTTLLNRILSNRRGIRFAVIVNDIGEINIDADLIAKGGIVSKGDESLVSLSNGCICCTLKMDLIAQLRDITSQKCFDYIVIEASGICEPEPIAQTICSIPAMGYDVVKDGLPRLDCIVTVVDALRMRDEFASGKQLLKKAIAEDDIENLVIQQLEFCNIVLLNKASEVSAEDLAVLKGIVRALQKDAKIIECDYGDVDFDEILNTGLFDFERTVTSAQWLKAVEGHGDDDEDDDHGHHHHHEDEGEALEYGISTFVYQRREPFDLNTFDNFVAKHWPKGIIRAKGICYFSEEFDTCYVFEQAGSQVSIRNAGQWYATMPDAELAEMMRRDPALAADWDPQYGDRMQKLVFIGRNMDSGEIARQLDLCLFE